MKYSNPLVSPALATSAVCSLLLAGTLSAQTTIFSHAFDDTTAGVDLDGTAPDVGGVSWVASPTFDTNGDVNVTNTVAGSGWGSSATLAFTPNNGFVYTLDASIGAISDNEGGTDWLAFGFAEGQSTIINSQNRFVNEATVGRSWMLIKDSTSGNNNAALLGQDNVGTSSNVAWSNIGSEGLGGNIDLRIVLDTTGGTGNWTSTWYASPDQDGNYTIVRSTATLLDESITSVGFAVSDDSMSGTVNSLSLTAIPEPSSMGLMAGCLGLFWVLSRRRRS